MRTHSFFFIGLTWSFVFLCLSSCSFPPSAMKKAQKVLISPDVQVSQNMLWPREGSSGLNLLMAGLADTVASEARMRGTLLPNYRNSVPGSFEDWVGSREDAALRLWFERELLQQINLNLQRRGLTVVSDAKSADVILQVSVPTWGFVAGITDATWQVTSKANLRFVDSFGKELWHSSANDIRAFGHPTRSKMDAPAEELKKNTALVKERLALSAENVIERATRKLGSSR